tara:strand:+ start:517 stop:768 length:252 start_codon:yes stop_codon:yes gene_type:complete
VAALVNKMNKTKLKKVIKEELQAALNEAHGGDSLGELERIADEFEEIAALSPSALIQRRLRELIVRQRQAVAAHRKEMSQPGW